MGRYAKINANNVVDNIIEADADFIASLLDETTSSWVEVDETVKIGSVKNGEEYIPTQVVELGLARSIRKAIIDAAYEADRADGITVGQITLGGTKADQAEFTAQAVLLREAQELGLITGDTEQTVADVSGAILTMTTTQLRTLLVGYGSVLKAMWTQKKAKLAAIDAAQTKAEIDAITWSDE